MPTAEQGAGQAGAQAGAQGGAHGEAASGATYVGPGAQAGAQTGARLNQLHGHRGQSRVQQQPEAAGIVATASKISNFFMILGLLTKQFVDNCLGRVV